MKNLVNPTAKYINRIENSKHMLNCPKHMLNHDLDCLYRQGIVINKDTAIKYMCDYLTYYNVPNPQQTAINFLNWRNEIKMSEFNSINVNSYIDNTPKHIEEKHRYICDWIDKHTTYYSFGGGGINNVPSYPFKFK